MAAGPTAGAPSTRKAEWNRLDWRAIRQQVYRLQVRIAKAAREKRYGKVKALQWILTHSRTAKLWAVRRVTTNRGKNTPGVDGVLWRTPQAKIKAARSMKRRGYRSQPLRRLYIPKSSGKQLRPLGIPTLSDRAMQALHACALEPVAEATADANSYGFRRNRSTADAIGQCFLALAKSYSAPWIVDADIKACFDRIDHEWSLRNIPMDRKILRTWLKAGYIDERIFYPTEVGTPQGGIISPTIANMALDGLEAAVRRVVPNRGAKVNVVRYADDFIITGSSKELLEEKVLPAVTAFLKERGLILSPEKTRLVHIAQGFDFLGFHLRKYRGKLLIQPAPEKVRRFAKGIRDFIKASVGHSTTQMLRRLNAKLRGWGHYYRHVVSKKTFAYVDREVDRALTWWTRRRHSGKTPAWQRRHHFRFQNGRRWIFFGTETGSDGRKQPVDLFKLGDIPIRRHVKIRGEARAYDPSFNPYFRRRWHEHQERRRVDRLFFSQHAPSFA